MLHIAQFAVSLAKISSHQVHMASFLTTFASEHIEHNIKPQRIL